MRFQCTFCQSILDAGEMRGVQIGCPNCGKKCFVPKNPASENTVIGDFVIKEKIGSGSVGTVYKAIQLSLGREVALKVLSPEFMNNPTVAENFLKEARAAAKLTHTNLVQALAVGVEDGIYYMAMTLINGETLKAKIDRDGAIQEDEALHIVQQVAEALYYAWDEAEIIHRDVKPENIIITDDGVVKLTDLGLAIKQGEWTEDMEISGSPSYMSPEQFSGEKLDKRSDIYSLGISLYQMLTGELPFNGDTFQEVAQQHFNETPIPVNKINPAIKQKVTAIVKKMMEKLPEDRYANMEELLKDIWSARQLTAPNKSLVPDIHTISIKRLDYTPQKELLDSQAETPARTIVPSKEKQLRHLLIGATALLGIIIIAIIVTAIIKITKPADHYESLLEQIKTLENTIEQKDISPVALEITAQKLLESFPAKRSAREETLLWRTKYSLAFLTIKKINAELEEKKYAAEESNRQSDELQKQYEIITHKYNQFVSQTQAANSTMTVGLRKLQSDNQKMETHNKILQAQVKNLQTQLYAAEYRAINSVIFSSIVNGEFQYAAAALKTAGQNKNYGRNDNWFDGYQKWLLRLKNDYQILRSGNQKLVGAKILNNYTVVTVNEGNWHCQGQDGFLKTFPWSEVPTETLAELLLKISPRAGDAKSELASDLELLKGNCCKALLLKNNEYNRDICTTIINNYIEKVLIIAEYDKAQATEKAIELNKKAEKTFLAHSINKKLGYLLH